MNVVRRARERRHDRRRNQGVWFTFYPQDRKDELAEGFGNLELFNENRLPPGATVAHHAHRDAEILTYVREGALAHQDSHGRSGIVQAGEFHRMTTREGVTHRETNASQSSWGHLFQIGLRPIHVEVELGQEQKRFSAAERRGALCLIASPDGRQGSLQLHQHAYVYSAILGPGHHVIHELAPGRTAWLHLIDGEVALPDLVLRAGDGVGISAERAVSLTSRRESEVLLIDLAAALAPTLNQGNR